MAAVNGGTACVQNFNNEREAANFCNATSNYGQVLSIIARTETSCFIALCERGYLFKGQITECKSLMRRWRRIGGTPTKRNGCRENQRQVCEFKWMNMDEMPSSHQVLYVEAKICIRRRLTTVGIQFGLTNGIEFFLGWYQDDRKQDNALISRRNSHGISIQTTIQWCSN